MGGEEGKDLGESKIVEREFERGERIASERRKVSGLQMHASLAPLYGLGIMQRPKLTRRSNFRFEQRKVEAK